MKAQKSKAQKNRSTQSNFFFKNTAVFPKLAIGQPNDKYEQEADAMADKVMRMPQDAPSRKKTGKEGSIVQRKCNQCEEKEGLQTKPMLQKMATEQEEDEMMDMKDH